MEAATPVYYAYEYHSHANFISSLKNKSAVIRPYYHYSSFKSNENESVHEKIERYLNGIIDLATRGFKGDISFHKTLLIVPPNINMLLQMADHFRPEPDIGRIFGPYVAGLLQPHFTVVVTPQLENELLVWDSVTDRVETIELCIED